MQSILTMPRIPMNVRSVFARPGLPNCGEERLFREIAARAVLDALGTTSPAETTDHAELVVQARIWLFGDVDCVGECFELGGLDLQAVRIALIGHWLEDHDDDREAGHRTH